MSNEVHPYFKLGTVFTRENSAQVVAEDRRPLLRPVKQFTKQIRDEETLKRVEDIIFQRKAEDARRDLKKLIANSEQSTIDKAFQSGSLGLT